ncbi:MAG: FecR family protein [Candidatus Puniceispirillaceae bacterium]
MFVLSRRIGFVANLCHATARLFAALSLVISVSLSQMTGFAFAQTGRPLSGVIAATDKPITISYVNEQGETIGRIAGVGEPIYLNDEISTPNGASLQVLLQDQTVFSIGPNSTLIFDEFVFDPTAVDEMALTASVTKGTFKFISGKVSKLKPGAMKLKLPNATASVRGTSVVGRVDETGGADLVLLSGAVQLQPDAASLPVDLIQPGWGVSIADTGVASEPTPFSAEDIDDIIQEVEFSEEEEAATEEAAATDEAGTAEEEGEAAPETIAEDSEAVETVTAAIEDAGGEVAPEEVVAILQESQGDPEAVAEAIVKVIIEDQIERGEISSEDLAAFTLFATGEDGDGGPALPEDFKIDDLNLEDVKVEDLAIAGIEFEAGDTLVEAFSSRLETDGLELPTFDRASFELQPTFFQPEDVVLTTKYEIEDVSKLVFGGSGVETDAPEIELSFFDLLFNAEVINEEFKRREASFSFEGDERSFDDGESDGSGTQQAGTDVGANDVGNEGSGPVITTEFRSTDTDAPSTPSAPILVSPTRGLIETKGPTLSRTPLEIKVPEAEKEGAGETELVLQQIVDTNFKEPTRSAPTPGYDTPEQKEEVSRSEFAAFLERAQLEYAENRADPLALYKEGLVGAQWLTYQSDGSLGNTDTFDGLVSSAYSGSARFSDSVAVKDVNTGFSALTSYDVKINYGTAVVSGNFKIQGMTLSGTSYVSESGSSSHNETISTTLGTSTAKLPTTNASGVITGGADENSDGHLDVGETIEQVRLTSVDFRNSATGSNVTSVVRTHVDMSVGSVITPEAVLNGRLGEFTIQSEEFSTTGCTPTCASLTKTGGVGLATSVVAAQ